MNKKQILFLILLMFSQIVLLSQKRKDRVKLWDSQNNYQTLIVGTGDDGTKVFKIWVEVKKPEEARVKALKFAVAAILFNGLPGEGGTKALVTTQEADKNEAFFDGFFETGAEYLKYVNMTTNPSGQDIVDMGKSYKIAVTVQVLYNKLRDELESKGVIKKLADLISEGKKPIIMIMPADVYCNTKGYMKDGYPDYEALFLNDREIRSVISEVEKIYIDRGYPLKNLEAYLKNIKSEAERSALTTSKDGKAIKESPLDIVSRLAQPDIILDLDISVKTQGQKQVYLTISAKDAYTSKTVATENGEGTASFSASINLLIEEIVLKFLDGFNNQLEKHFKDIQANGREIVISGEIWDGATDMSGNEVDFEKEYDYEGEVSELTDCIDYWLSQNTINKKYSLLSKSANKFKFEQVRIPLTYESRGQEKPMDANAFGNNIKKMLKDDPFNIDVKVQPVGLGQVNIILGGK